MTDQKFDLHAYGDRNFATDQYVMLKRIEILRGKLVAHLRGLTSLQLRFWDETFDDYVGGHVERTFPIAARSLLLCVAQYWNDNADDEVHLQVIASTRATPRWPHTCRDPGEGSTDVDLCHSCTSGDAYINWGYTDLIPAFEAFAIEGANQGMDDADAYRPLAVARRGDDGAIAVEIVHPLIRPWLDAMHERAPARPVSARAAALLGDELAVAADVLQHEGDPRGELIAHALLGADHAEALAAHGRTWLGALEPWVPRSGVVFETGVPREIGIYAPPDQPLQLPVDDPLPWRFRPRLRFLPTSQRVIVPAMAAARALGPVGAAELAKVTFPLALETLELEVDTANDLDALDHALPHLPALRELVLVGDGATAALIPWLARWPARARLTRLELAAPLDAEAHGADLAAWRAANLDVVVSMYDAETQRASGWSVDLRDGRARLTHAGFHRGADDARLDVLRGVLGPCELVPSRTWTP